ncbi:hypothetical protein NL676_029242 [Syzygium grande]|nr:hypothetical protein NL676_029242 [Syzygium grande]
MAVIVSSLKVGTMMIAIAAFLLFALPPVTAKSVYKTLQLSQGTKGPKSLAFDCLGAGPYICIFDGRIMKYVPLLSFTDFSFMMAVTP